MRAAILNGELQSDLDAKGFSIKNLGSSSALQSGTIYVDPNVPTEAGQIDSATPFKTLAAALAVAPPGYTIIMRPATYRFDGIVEVPRAGIKIFGYGALIRPLTIGATAGIRTSASDVMLVGLSFDAGAAPGVTNIDDGAVQVSGLRVVLKDLTITNQAGVGISLLTRFGGVIIDNCRIQTSYRGITSSLDGIPNSEVSILNSFIENNRADGIRMVGDDNVTAVQDILITNTRVASNGTTSNAGISISGASNILISYNSINTQYDGIVLTKVRRASISGNVMAANTNRHIAVIGHQLLKVEDNIIDSGHAGIEISGDYAAANDSGPSIIAGNQINGLSAGGRNINAASFNDMAVVGNTLKGAGTCIFAGFTNLKFSGNNIYATAVPISLDAATRGWVVATISENSFFIQGATTSLILSIDALGSGMTDLYVIGNTSPSGQTYANGIYKSATPPVTGIHFSANLPISTSRLAGLYDPRFGWVNDSMTRFEADQHAVEATSAFGFYFGGVSVVKARNTGWTAWTGTGSKATKVVSTATTADCAAAIKSLLDALITHGLIGP